MRGLREYVVDKNPHFEYSRIEEDKKDEQCD